MRFIGQKTCMSVLNMLVDEAHYMKLIAAIQIGQSTVFMTVSL